MNKLNNMKKLFILLVTAIIGGGNLFAEDITLDYNYVFTGSGDRKAWWDDGNDKPDPAIKTIETISISVQNYKEFKNGDAVGDYTGTSGIRIPGGGTISINFGSRNVKNIVVHICEVKNSETLTVNMDKSATVTTITNGYSFNVSSISGSLTLTIDDSSPESVANKDKSHWICVNHIEVTYEENRAANTLSITTDGDATNYAGSTFNTFTTALPTVFDVGVTSNNISAATISTSGSSVTALLSSEGKLTVTPTGTTGTTTITITVPGTETYARVTQTMTVSVTELGEGDTYAYQVGVDGAKAKFWITGEGTLTGGTQIKTVPGITMTYGYANEPGWSVYNSTSGGYSGLVAQKSSEITLNSNGIPTDGCFYKFTPDVYGFLTVDGSFYDKHYIILRSEDGISYSESIRNTSGQWQDVGTFAHVLKPGVTYYLWDNGDKGGKTPGANSNYAFKLHGFTFEPAFVFGEDDTEKVETLNAYYNIYNIFPFIGDGETSGLSYAVGSDDSSIINAVSTKTGAVTLNEQAGTATITGSVNKGSLTTTTSYTINSSLYTGTIYKVEDGFQPSVQQRLEVGDIAVTFGGCKWGDNEPQDYQYQRQGTGLASAKADKYNKSKAFYGGQLEGFLYYTVTGGNNPKDEAGYNFKQGTYSDESIRRFNVPCRGTFFKFQTKADGNLSVFILQNGVTLNDDNGTYDPSQPMNYRRLWIIDEMGKPVQLLAWSTNYKIPGEYENQSKVHETAEPDFSAELFEDYWSSKHQGETGDILYVPDNLKTPNQARKAEQNEMAENLVTLRSGLCKYKFHVEAGKTYFIFVNRSGTTGLSGFMFDKDDYTSNNQVALNQEGTYTKPANGNHATVSMNGRTVNGGVWQPICLPFSMDEQQVIDVFGEGTEVAHFDHTDNGKLWLKRHAYQMIVGGVPCYIKIPTTITFSDSKKIENVTFLDSDTPSDVIDRYGDNAYYLKGNYGKATMPANSYFISGGEFYLTTTGTKEINGFRNFIVPVAGGAKVLSSDFMMEDIEDRGGTTYIGNIYTDGETLPTANDKIFNLNGQQMENVKNMTALPKGVYIVNGKKVIIK